MNLAIVFDDLIQYGGAERLLLAIHQLYPGSPVYTSMASREWLDRCRDYHLTLVTSFMQKLPFKVKLNRFYGLLGFHTIAFESFNFDGFDLVLSVSARFAHAVVTRPSVPHICYLNSPGRMFWEPSAYFEHESFLSNVLVRKLFNFLSLPFLSLLRLWDYSAAQRVDHFIANSHTPKDRVKKYYHRDSTVIYPFSETYSGKSLTPVIGDYYLIISRLVAWKRVDIAVKACSELDVKLKVIGEGSDKTRLLSLAGNDLNIEYLGYVGEDEKNVLISGCRALIVTQEEDFGITALEAMSQGKPVIAFRAGGALETIREGVTGVFYHLQTPSSLKEVLSTFDPLRYSSEDCIIQAEKFSKSRFLKELDGFVKNVYHGKNNLP